MRKTIETMLILLGMNWAIKYLNK